MTLPRGGLTLFLLPAGLIALLDASRSRTQAAPPPLAAVTPAIIDTVKAVANTTLQRVASPVLVETDGLQLLLSPDSPGARIRTVQFLRNESDGVATVTCVRALLRDSTAGSLAVNAAFGGRNCVPATARGLRLPAWSVTPVTVDFAPPSGAPPYVGYLVFSMRDSLSDKDYLTMRPLNIRRASSTRPAGYANAVVAGSFVCALVLAGAATWKAKEKSLEVANHVEAPTWDPRTSWASNVGVAGGLLTALLTAAFLPDQPVFLSKVAYTLLATLFGAITGLAPGVFAFVVQTESNQRVMEGVLAASAVTLWGALGQLATALAWFGEMIPGGVLPWIATRTLQGLVLFVAVALAAYAFRSIRVPTKAADEAAAVATGKRYTLL